LPAQAAHALSPNPTSVVLTVADLGFDALTALLAGDGLRLVLHPDAAAIPGSFWGEPEAGIIGDTLHARTDTPIHSLLHEAAHVLVARAAGRRNLHTNASDSTIEEDASLYLQLLMAGQWPGVGHVRIAQDMDAWGYTFRLGSAAAWFADDADDARAWLTQHGLYPRADVGNGDI